MTQYQGKMYNRTIRLTKGCSLFVNEIQIVNGDGVIVAPVTITGNLAVTGTLSATGNFSIATNKFTVAAASGNTVVAGTLAVTGASTFTGTTTRGGLTINSETPQTLTGAGAVNLTTMVTELVTTGANALTLAAGTQGQLKTIVMKTDGGDGTLTLTNPGGFTTVVFNDAGDAVQLYYTTSKWYIISNQGCTLS